MRKINALIIAGAVAGSLFLSCRTSYQAQAVQYQGYRITPSTKRDSSLVLMMKPYKDSVDNSMNTVIAVAGTMLEKKQPEGTLGNVLADAMYAMAAAHYKMPVDAAFINYGGIRLPSIPAGDITRGKIFELAPFDNVIVLQKLSGRTVKEFIDHIAARIGGWPVAGATWQVKDKKAINITIGGKPLDLSATYIIANNDYVANGGDDCVMLKPFPQINDGYVFRDAVIAYFSKLHREGKTITATIENRVTNAN